MSAPYRATNQRTKIQVTTAEKRVGSSSSRGRNKLAQERNPTDIPAILMLILLPWLAAFCCDRGSGLHSSTGTSLFSAGCSVRYLAMAR